MKRRLRLFVLGVFGPLTAALVALWVRSYWVGDRLYVYNPPAGVEWRLYGARGVVGYYRVTWDATTASEGVKLSQADRGHSTMKAPGSWDERIRVLQRNADLKAVGPV